MKTFFAQPLITEKSLALTGSGVYQFVVPTWATKQQIREFVTTQFDVIVQDVQTSRMRGESVRFRYRPGQRPSYKKATVHLTKGQSINAFSLPVESETSTPSPEAQPMTEASQPTESKITVRSKAKTKKAGV